MTVSHHRRHPGLMIFGIGVLIGVAASGLIASPALLVLLASTLTAAALAPAVAGIESGGWAASIVARASNALAATWPMLRVETHTQRRARLFASIAGLNTGIFISFIARAYGA